MIAYDGSGNYIKGANLSDSVPLNSIFGDWRVSSYMRKWVPIAIKNSAGLENSFTNNLLKGKPIVLLYCLADDTPVAALLCEIHYRKSTVNLLGGAVDTAYRSSGHFLNFIRMFTWLVNEHLKLEECYFEVYSDINSVRNMSVALGATILGETSAKDGVSKKLYGKFSRSTVKNNITTFLAGTQFFSDIPASNLEQRLESVGLQNYFSFTLEWSINGDTKVTSRDTLYKGHQ